MEYPSLTKVFLATSATSGHRSKSCEKLKRGGGEFDFSVPIPDHVGAALLEADDEGGSALGVLEVGHLRRQLFTVQDGRHGLVVTVA